MDIHPLISHFPIALLLVGVACDVIGIIHRRDFFLRTGYLLFSLGALSAIPVALTGERAAEAARDIDRIAADLDDHDTFGTAATLLALALALARTHFAFKKRFAGGVRYAYLALALITAGLVCAAGYTGGHLVYHYGAGTKPVIETLPIKPEKRVLRRDIFESKKK